MTQEEKSILLKDLCARLPYGVKAILSEYHIDEFPYTGTYCDKVINLGTYESTINLLNHIEKYGVKPYLRPMSSMTEEEIREFTSLIFISDSTSYGYLKECVLFAIYSAKALDWLNAHHFDYRGLIEKGLALEATEGMYNLNEK